MSTSASTLRHALRIRDVSKTFAGTTALSHVSFDVTAGTIHGLLGGNGSGKSTLIKILAGVYHADPGGKISVGESTIAADSTTPDAARLAGMRFVHQSQSTFPELTVAENMAIGDRFPLRLGAVRWGRLRDHTQALLERFGIDATPRDVLGELRPATQTMIAIARALQSADTSDSSVLVLDEPTASLPEQEVEILLAALRRYAAAGQTILYVSHRIEEVMAITDAVTVLRDGHHVVTRERAGMTERELIQHIVGRPLDDVYSTTNGTAEAGRAAPRMKLTGVRGGPLRGVDLELYPGEILGIAGLQGSGRTELLQMLFGVLAVEAGDIELEGAAYAPRSTRAAIDRGVALVPEHRERDALFTDRSVRENFSASSVTSYVRRLRLDHQAERSAARSAIAEFSIRTPHDSELISSLSGGNQQKVVLARWLARNPKVLLLDEPTQGVDIGARTDVYRSIRAKVDEGLSAILVSSDFHELALASDRVLVLRDGRMVDEFAGEHLSAQHLTHAVHTAGNEGT